MSSAKTRILRSDSMWGRIQQRLDALPKSQPEDSVVLRALVQILVTIGILSVSVAAAGVTATSSLNLLAIPFSAIGATWSGYRRHQRNTAVKFCIAIGMLVALSVFLLRLNGQLADTRILLAELLIHLQVLHSFDMPRRKDLGYSIVIGLILLGVAATVSQTLTFGPLLVVFLAIALPVLVLDYRSRIGLLSQGWLPLKTGLPLRRLGVVLLVTLGLGLTIFALLPRLPGYQLQSFPVSADIEVQGEFDSSAISNSGYVQSGREDGESGGPGNGSLEFGAGQMDQKFYYGFNQRINQNLRGELTPEVVMRVRSQAEGFWRMMAFDRYTGQGWEVSRNDDAEDLERSSWSYRFFLPQIPGLSRDRKVIQTYTVVSDMPSLIPALYQAEELYFPTQEIAIDAEGALRAPVPLTEGLTYTVISEVPARDRTRLRQAEPIYSKAIREHYLQIPEAIAPRVRQRAEELLAQSEQPITQPYEQALYLAQALKQQYEIRPDLPFLAEDEDLVEAFLFKHQGGYPDHFSTVLTMMLRSLGIPARLVAGFAPGQFNPFTGFYVVRNTDAYAMTEVYFPRYGWFAFDPIPGHEVIPPSFEDFEAFSTVRQFWRWVAGWLPSPVTGLLGGLFALIGRLIAWGVRLFRQGWIGTLLGLVLLTGLGFLGWLGWDGWRSWRYRRWLAKLPPMEQIYQRMVRSLAAEGIVKPAHQTPLEYGQQAQAQVGPERSPLVAEITAAYMQWRYGGYPPDVNYLRGQLRSLQRRRPKSSIARFRRMNPIVNPRQG